MEPHLDGDVKVHFFLSVSFYAHLLIHTCSASLVRLQWQHKGTEIMYEAGNSMFLAHMEKKLMSEAAWGHDAH